MNQGQMDHLQLEAMAEQAKESQAKDAMVRDKSTGEAGVSPKLLFKALMPNGLKCQIFDDGSTEGFPENTFIYNYWKPVLDFERGLQKQSKPVAQEITTDDKAIDPPNVDQCLKQYLLNRQRIYPHLQNITVEALKEAVVRTEYTVPSGEDTVRCVLHVSSLGDDVGIRGEYKFMSKADFEYRTGCELAYLSAMFSLIKYESFHFARVAEEKAKWMSGVEQDARSTFGSVAGDCTDRATGQCCGNESIHDRIVAMDQDFAEKLFCYIADLVKQIKKDSADMAVDRAAGQCVAASVTVQPHQQRVIDEKAALDKNAKALSVFISVNPVFETLDPAEQERMKVQNDLMWQYSEVLGQRIAAFGDSATPEFRTSTKDSGC